MKAAAPGGKLYAIRVGSVTKPELSPRELAVTFTDTKGYFVSEASVYHLLKTHDRIISVRLPPLERFPEQALGVGQVFAQVSRLGAPRLGRSCGTFPSFWLDPQGVALVVG